MSKFPELSYQNKNYPLLIGFGNPILDMTCKINSNEIFIKYGLKENQPCERSSEQIECIKEDALKLSGGRSSINPGGSSLNSLRILSLLLQSSYEVLHCGSIGNDANGKTLLNLLNNSYVNFRCYNKGHNGIKHGENAREDILMIIREFTDTVVIIIPENLRSLTQVIPKQEIPEVIPDQATANCLCLTYKDSSCMIADISAALHYKLDFITNTSLMEDVLNTSFVYVEGFFIPNRYNVCEYLLKEICEKNGIVFILNLSGTYICKEFQNECKTLAESADAVFGNVEQFMELGKSYDFTDLDNVMMHLIKTYKFSKKKCNNFQGKIVVATDASKPVTIFYQQGDEICKTSVEVKQIPPIFVKDTSGAGDAFLAGFLYAFLQNKPLQICADFGNLVAADIIKNIGVNLTSQFLKINKVC